MLTTAPPPWVSLGGGADVFLLRTITRAAICTPQEYADLQLVSRSFHKNVRCTRLVFADGVRRILARWHCHMSPQSSPSTFVVWRANGRVRVSSGPALCSRRHMLSDMLTWLRRRSYIPQAGPCHARALRSMTRACAHAMALREWCARFRYLARTQSHLRRHFPTVAWGFSPE